MNIASFNFNIDETICAKKFLQKKLKGFNFRNFVIYTVFMLINISCAHAENYINDTNLHAEKEKYIGEMSENQYDPDSVSNPYGQYGNPYSSDSINNPYGEYGSPYSNKSTTNPYATDSPKLYDQNGNYRGKMSENQYDSDSVSNPYGQYGNPYSSDSINNPYGAGNPYSSDVISIYGQ